MRISIYQLILLTIFTQIAFATTGKAQEVLDKKITFQARQETVNQVLTALGKLANVKFLYSSTIIQSDRRISVSADDQQLGALLDSLLAPLQLTYEVSGRQIVLSRAAGSGATKVTTITVSGHVVDEKGTGLPGVTVKVKGSSNGTTTDANGHFQLNVADGNATLVFSYVGYTNQEIALEGRTTLNVSLAASANSLNDVVVVGYGQQKKSSLTGAIAAISAKDIENAHGGATVSTALAGKIPGVTFRMSDGRPGASADINIRNMGNPLYVIDGIQQDAGQFNNISPNDIESITVLKDASAAIYGVRAANGVVVVTTKKGKLGAPNRFNVDAYTGWQNWTRFPKVTNAYEWQEAKVEADVNTTGVTTMTPDELAKWKKGTDAGYKSFDWYKFIVKPNAPLYSANLNTSGGSDKINYYVSGTYLKQYSVLGREFTFDRANFQSNIDAKVNKRLKLGMQLNGRLETRDQPGVPGTDDYWEARFAILRNTPMERPYANDNPNYPNNINHNTENWALQTKKLSGYWHSDWRVLQANVTGDYETPLKGLFLRGMFSYYYANQILNGHEYTYNVYTYDPTTQQYNISGGSSNPWRERTNEYVISPVTQVQLNYNRTFGKHTLGATALNERIERHHISNYTHAVPTNNELPLIFFSDMDTYTDVDAYENRIGYVGRVTYNYDNKYYFEASARRDASYKFDPSKRWGTFPSVSGGWRISQEPFFNNHVNAKAMSELKIRASYGTLGDDDIGLRDYAYLPGYYYGFLPQSAYTTDTYLSSVILGGQTVKGARNTGVPITRLSWFTSKILDLGADFSLLNDKLSGTIDYFNRKRTGLRGAKYDVLVPSELGYSLPDENVSSDQVRGGEVALSFRDTKNGFTYSIGGNFSYARQKFLDSYKPKFGSSLDHYFSSGEQRNSNLFWGYEAIGQFQSQDEINNYTINNDGQNNKTMLPGDIKYKDINKDGVIDNQDTRPIGYGTGKTPIMNFGINLSFAYKGFDLVANFSGGAMYSFNRNYEMRWPFQNGGALQKIFYDDHWHREDPFNPNSKWIAGKYPAMRFNDGGNSNYNKNSTFWLVNVKYLRCRTLELGYSLSKPLLERSRISRARIYVNAYNLFSIDNTHQYGVDAEIYDDNGLTYPQSKFVNVGVNLSF
ncbi:TonB-linked outer membrane protein, SusC/RagA family [Chitinophaga costaii]|uniref:TonB-linked outer membrane protein, SusC/RagA family n=1 Tax=Chitinophaga costaii TaxID=1335309 RepID=A0A1C4DU53_9BACT|nr:TonB-dependent receptor [Chitinophaga costaii]PUZ27790.1 SusC/RagA family TonB-linked outer membrane protein [Chitinophaga costaii]SCC34800.1 TonB-linked outer membrane protein, SusC/RagA family [Chitinophaga costaii]